MPGADRADHERRRQIRRQHHMNEAIGKRRIENHLEPVGGDELAGRVDGVAGRRLHPGIGRQDPERRDQRADRHHQRREEMQPVADALEAEQHDAEKARLEEERGQHLIGHQRADHRAGLVGEYRPVGAELVGHHDARHHAHAEGDREDLQPVIEQIDEDLAPGPQPQRLQHREIAGEPDREGGKHDVKRHREGELRPRQYYGIPAFEHRHHPLPRRVGMILSETGLTHRVQPEGMFFAACPSVKHITPEATMYRAVGEFGSAIGVEQPLRQCDRSLRAATR